MITALRNDPNSINFLLIWFRTGNKWHSVNYLLASFLDGRWQQECCSRTPDSYQGLRAAEIHPEEPILVGKEYYGQEGVWPTGHTSEILRYLPNVAGKLFHGCLETLLQCQICGHVEKESVTTDFRGCWDSDPADIARLKYGKAIKDSSRQFFKYSLCDKCLTFVDSRDFVSLAKRTRWFNSPRKRYIEKKADHQLSMESLRKKSKSELSPIGQLTSLTAITRYGQK